MIYVAQCLPVRESARCAFGYILIVGTASAALHVRGQWPEHVRLTSCLPCVSMLVPNCAATDYEWPRRALLGLAFLLPRPC